MLYEIEFFLLDFYGNVYNSGTELSMKVDVISNITKLTEDLWSFFLANKNLSNQKNSAYAFGMTSVFINSKHNFFFDKLTLVGTPNLTTFLRFSSPSITHFYKELLIIFIALLFN